MSSINLTHLTFSCDLLKYRRNEESFFRILISLKEGMLSNNGYTTLFSIGPRGVVSTDMIALKDTVPVMQVHPKENHTSRSYYWHDHHLTKSILSAIFLTSLGEQSLLFSVNAECKLRARVVSI